ncbi:BZ3500_MvSof-1268-A1-R1_Chr3-1g06013 [Microbotryum saponariae]|uniref:BZ3500_MvSof-1268-A1-R1_Chr3-1g06013 protein n=1 Tax=Microbotryum saponariae TaxID=289078 RepID=A0A2X0LKA3_9BASI|nr:BZ3500_MvSof-1268-A1-R1_Chr3-1g06013 [Microbotryum saponariae]SDA05203.1 BZ3501_MvSof-1269-A2-R1_Chr3-1g05683 [Microbotryum saponariae]
MVVKPNRSGGANYPSGYTDVQDHGLIGNCRTVPALVSISGTVASLCLPHFDSPSVYARILDKNHGGHWSIRTDTPTQSKQQVRRMVRVPSVVDDHRLTDTAPRVSFQTVQYLPSTNILATKFLSDAGVGQVTDFFPMSAEKDDKSFLPWLIRYVTVIRGELTFTMENAPAFNYARSTHTTTIAEDGQSVKFECPDHLNLDMRAVASAGEFAGPGAPLPTVSLELLDLSERGHKGLGVTSTFTLKEGESITFVLRECPTAATMDGVESLPHIHNLFSCVDRVFPQPHHSDAAGSPVGQGSTSSTSGVVTPLDPPLSMDLLWTLYHQTTTYWIKWSGKCSYEGRWREVCLRSALALKLLCFAPTGAIVAAPTFSLPEDLDGAGRNWDYRYSWLRDSVSVNRLTRLAMDAEYRRFAIVLLGFTEEADRYIEWLSKAMKNKKPDGGLYIMYNIRAGTDGMEEVELEHLDGHKGQKPVRVGNGAADHLQLDIMGELMDAIYLAQKLSKPLSYDTWVEVRGLVDWTCDHWDQPDLSIWEVRGKPQDFLYSKIMCWVAIDRGLRLADKRSLPAPNRNKWLETRDKIYEEVQTRGYNQKAKFYAQSYQSIDVLDSAVLIMPLCFFCTANDPRFLNTVDAIMKSRDRGGLTENNLVYRYDTSKVDDGTGGGEEGAFSMVTLWLIEALSRAGEFEPTYLAQAVSALEDFIGYSNHVMLLSEEVSKGGEPLGNFPQAFSHVSLISTCFNVDRAMRTHRRSDPTA